jgi:hypothetical protein
MNVLIPTSLALSLSAGTVYISGRYPPPPAFIFADVPAIPAGTPACKSQTEVRDEETVGRGSAPGLSAAKPHCRVVAASTRAFVARTSAKQSGAAWQR